VSNAIIAAGTVILADNSIGIILLKVAHHFLIYVEKTAASKIMRGRRDINRIKN
jgi:hypothetical protein